MRGEGSLERGYALLELVERKIWVWFHEEIERWEGEGTLMVRVDDWKGGLKSWRRVGGGLRGGIRILGAGGIKFK